MTLAKKAKAKGAVVLKTGSFWVTLAILIVSTVDVGLHTLGLTPDYLAYVTMALAVLKVVLQFINTQVFVHERTKVKRNLYSGARK